MGWFDGFKPRLAANDRGELTGCYLRPGSVDGRPVTKLRKNMKNRSLPLYDELLLRRRAPVETADDQLRNISQVEHRRRRPLWDFLGDVAAGLIAYTWREKKPSLHTQLKEQFLISN